MRYEVSGEVRAPVDAVWAWWTDFGEPGEETRMSHGVGRSRRRIVSRDAQGAVLEDRSLLGLIRREVAFDGPRSFREVGSGDQTYESHWRFDAVGPDRTRVTRTMRVRAAPALAPFVRWLTWQDLRHHCRVCERELRST